MQVKRALTLSESYRGLVRSQAWKAWKALPNSVKVWIGIEDLIEHGMWLAYIFIKKHYDPRRADSITTGLYHFLHSVFIYEYIEVYGAHKRGWTRTADGKLVSINMNSLQGMQERLGPNAVLDDVVGFIPSMVTGPDTITNIVDTRCFVIPALTNVYEQSSLKLKAEMLNWLWNGERVHTKGKPFKRLSKEFRKLCKTQDLGCNDLCHLVKSPECLDTFSRKVLGVPFDLDNPTPEINSNLFSPSHRSVTQKEYRSIRRAETRRVHAN